MPVTEHYYIDSVQTMMLMFKLFVHGDVREYLCKLCEDQSETKRITLENVPRNFFTKIYFARKFPAKIFCKNFISHEIFRAKISREITTYKLLIWTIFAIGWEGIKQSIYHYPPTALIHQSSRLASFEEDPGQGEPRTRKRKQTAEHDWLTVPFGNKMLI